ncbi:MAG: Cobalamin import ATP-binding protein BtuD [Candidatus Methanolliviera sp. GoM_asphalt]|nr:MAG: Cobalamin import ATP-binding protein BtuD [Candidatus Methanolliviera sp. GoM_asphalt]
MKLEISGVSFDYNSRPVLKDVNIEVKAGEIVSLLGPNGSGKTTLLRCIDGMLKPKGGTVSIDGRDVKKMKQNDLAKLLGYVPQRAVNVLPCSVFDAVMIGRRPYIGWGSGKKDREVVFEILKLMGLGDMALRSFDGISGGEMQKVLIAKALAQEPAVLLLDEPTSNLDLRHQLEVLKIIGEVVKEEKVSALMAMHDLNLASRFSDRIVLLKEGKVYDVGDPGSVITQESIRSVYGVEAIVKENDGGRPHIIPLRAI